MTNIITSVSQYIGHLRQQLKSETDHFCRVRIVQKIKNAESVLIDLGAMTEKQRFKL